MELRGPLGRPGQQLALVVIESKVEIEDGLVGRPFTILGCVVVDCQSNGAIEINRGLTRGC